MKYSTITERKEEFANTITHGFGIALFLTLIPFLLNYAQNHDVKIWPIVGYSVCLIIMYINSTLYHSAKAPENKRIFRIIDHVSIFLLIGGTFTPIVVYNMGNWNGMPFLIFFWVIMLCGIIFKIFFTGRYKLISTLIYIGVSWIGAILSWRLLQNMSFQIILFIILGGIFYTAGTYFYMRKKMGFHHAIWHIFVLAGSVSHFFAIRFSI